MLIAVRKKIAPFEADVSYLLDGQTNDGDLGATVRRVVEFKESTELVDGIGGTTWEGSLVLTKLLEQVLLSNISPENNSHPVHLVELGCGAGMSGIVAAKYNTKVTLTDRNCDLSQVNIDSGMNIQHTKVSPNMYNKFSTTNSDRVQTKHVHDVSNVLSKMSLESQCTDIVALNLSWENNDSGIIQKTYATDDHSEPGDHGNTPHGIVVEHSVQSLLSLRGPVDIVFGSEITCLYKQQRHLIATIKQLCLSNPLAVVLLTFDDVPPPHSKTKYESEFIRVMMSEGFQSAVLCTAEIQWLKEDAANTLSNVDTNDKREDSKSRASSGIISNDTKNITDDSNFPVNYAYLHDLTHQNTNDLGRVSFPSLTSNMSTTTMLDTTVRPSMEKDSTTHHVTAFYQLSAVNTCSCCHQQFFRLSALNTAKSCRHHSGFYVCRYHPAETRLSINGQGDSLGSYGNGQEGWEAKFWDCCGSEDTNAPGCRCGPHTAY